MRPAAVLLVLILAGCSLTPLPPGADCGSGVVRLVAAHNSDGLLPACIRQGPEAFELAIRPEAYPINPSPWYAFTLQSEVNADVTVNLDYGPFEHRYIPKQLRPTGAWQALDPEAVLLSPDRRQASIRLGIQSGETRIAAQEVLSAEEREAWTSDFAERKGLTKFEIARSAQGRSIHALQSGAQEPGTRLIVILGGQHPPEVPGTLGLRSFLETVFASEAAAEDLLGTHAFLIVPDLNPDGIAEGYWRLNHGLVDLNRDWGPFSQPETRAVAEQIERLRTQGLRPYLLLDFHATRREILYIPEADQELMPQTLVQEWIAEIERLWAGEMPPVRAGHNPASRTAKVWFAETYGAPGVTVEYGDETERELLKAYSETAATALLSVLYQIPKDEVAP